MALSVNFWRLGSKAIRCVAASSEVDEPVVGVPPGAMLFRSDTGEHRTFTGSEWMSAGGGAQGEDGEDGRSVAVFEQAGEPLSAVAGDLWIVP